METEFAALTTKPEELTRIARRSFELRQELSFLFESNERNFVYWYERRNKGVFLTATPIDVQPDLTGAAVRTIRHSHTDFRNTDGGRALRLHPAAAWH